MFFISPQIFQIEYSENMNEIEVCVRPWYLWDVTLVCRDGNYKDLHKYLGTFGSEWAACCTGTCSVVELYLISLSLSQWANYILWQPQSVQLPVWHLVPSPWPHQVAFATGLPRDAGDQQQGLHHRRLFRQSTQGPWGWLQRWEKGLTWLHLCLSTPDNLFALDLACLRKWWTETSFMYSWLLYGHSQLPVLVLLSLEIGHTKNELFRNSVLIPKAGGSWRSWWQ